MVKGVTCFQNPGAFALAKDALAGPTAAVAWVVHVRALAVPSMFPSALRDGLAALPYPIACAVAPPEALLPQFGTCGLGDTVVIVGKQRVGVIPSQTPDVLAAVFGVLRATLSPWLGRADQAQWDDEGSTDPFAVLGVSPDDSFDAIRATWRARLQEYHPDKFTQAGAKIRAVAADESRRLNAAYARIAAQSGRTAIPKV